MSKPPTLSLSGRQRDPGTPARRTPRRRTSERGSLPSVPDRPTPAAPLPLTEPPDDRVVRLPEALRILGVSRATLYRMPLRRVKITEGRNGSVGWWLSELRLYLALHTSA